VVAKEQEREEERKKDIMTGQEKPVVVSHIDTAVQFWVNLAGNNELESLEEKMSQIQVKKVNKIIVGKMVAALYDGLYCRARVAKKDSRTEGFWFVIFVDYGNRASIPERNMSVLPLNLGLNQWPQLAQRCQLAALRAPPRFSEYFNISGETFAQLIMPGPIASSDETSTEANKSQAPLVKELKIKILWDDYRRRKWYVLLMDQNTSINDEMLKEGYARYDNKGKETPPELLAAKDEFSKEYLKTAQKLSEEALEARHGLWESGDIDSDDEEELF